MSGGKLIMDKHSTALLLWLYEDHVNGVYPQKVNAEDLGMSREELIRAGKVLKEQGFLPEFNASAQGSDGNKIIFFGKLTDKAIEYAKKFDED